ncbi:hypothetical protein NO2_1492, partial [Candidatus Termititenax persephonae]
MKHKLSQVSSDAHPCVRPSRHGENR